MAWPSSIVLEFWAMILLPVLSGAPFGIFSTDTPNNMVPGHAPSGTAAYVSA